MAFELNGRIGLWNLAAEKPFGWSEQDVLGCPVPMIVDESDNPDNNSTLLWKAIKRAWWGMF